MKFKENDRVWYHPVLGDGSLRFAGVIVAEGGMVQTYRVRMVAAYFAWISADALLARPSQEAPCLAETHLKSRKEPEPEIDSGAPLLNYSAAIKKFENTMNHRYGAVAMGELLKLARDLARAIAAKNEGEIRSLLGEANQLREHVMLDTSDTFYECLKALGGGSEGGTWVYPSPAGMPKQQPLPTSDLKPNAEPPSGTRNKRTNAASVT